MGVSGSRLVPEEIPADFLNGPELSSSCCLMALVVVLLVMVFEEWDRMSFSSLTETAVGCCCCGEIGRIILTMKDWKKAGREGVYRAICTTQGADGGAVTATIPLSVVITDCRVR